MIPSISVVVPVYNRPELIRSVVESILGQTLPVAEVLIVNDGSTEDVEGEIRKNMLESSRWAERVTYLSQANEGQSVALNKGIFRAKGEWVAFNANDDLWLPQKLERQFDALMNYGNQYGLSFTDAWFMNNPPMKRLTLFEFAKVNLRGEMGQVSDPVRLLLRNQPVWCQTVMARTDLVRNVGGFDPLLRFSEDYDFVFRMAHLTKFCYVGLPMVLIDRTISPTRHSGASLNWTKKEFKLQMDGRRLEKQLKLTEGLAPDIQEAARENMRAHYSKWANLHLMNRDFLKAREAADQAAKYKFTFGIALKQALTRFTPRLARKIVVQREAGDPSRTFGLNW